MELFRVLEKMTHRGEAAKRLVSLQRPELLDSFLTYQNEAIQARILLHASLTELKIGSKILEVGGGILALAIQLASEGFDVTTVEPIGEGFDHILFMSDVYKQISQNEDLRIKVIEKPIEDCQFDVKFDFIFSINVMEHLKNPYSAFIKIVDTLKSGGTYRFFCPNYDFPYEPHFGKWLFKRSNNAFYLPEKRANSHLFNEKSAPELYKSLNFLTLRQLKTNLEETNFYVLPNKNALFDLVVRSINDSELQKRHKGIAWFAKIIFRLRLHYLLKLIPTNYQPIMDVEITTLSN